MLNHIPRSIPPIIKKLAPQNMSSNSPNTLIPFTNKPLVAQVLGIEVVHFEGAVVHVRGGVSGHEEGVVVGVSGADVDVAKDGDVGAEGGVGRVGVDVEEVGGG